MSGDNLPAAPPQTTRVGYLLGPHGVQGGIKLFVLGEVEQLRPLKRVYIEGKGWLNIRRTETLAPGLVLHLAGISSREATAELRGLNVYAADADLPPLEDGSYYYHDLRGLPVRSVAGEVLAEVSDVLDMGHQDLLLVTHPAGQSYLPLQAPYVEVKLAGRKPVAVLLTDDAPEGLLSGDEPDAQDEGMAAEGGAGASQS